ncbi:MAG TPA: DUF3795 domain-containing protein [Candidatus Faecivivens stercoripullorum]|uniref:DUF3795 domain-containing protein n=1 Tax=Candidatus Faecivivens stercoripullorum TaxID=2840805 RepID=A0A9D1H766_9FIRM|nr:DUF3795 domain-containing protein [Candidatus Faecivivens stercoripullorum]
MCTSNCSICGADCNSCTFRTNCAGCAASDGKPFGEKCLVAAYCQKGENAYSQLQERLIAAYNALNIPDMAPVTELHPLPGSFINLRCPLPNGQTVQFWDDRKIYLGNQLCKKDGGGRCYGLAADDHYLMVSEYGDMGSDPEIVVFKRWN